MSIDYIETIVNQRIPTKCLQDIETWLLSRIFKAEVREDYIGFYGSWDLNHVYEGELCPDDELTKALVASRATCPELCAAVECEINKSSRIIVGAVHYQKIFQSIIRRHSDFVRHVSIIECHRNTKCLGYDEICTLITADAIESLVAEQLYEHGTFKNVQAKRRSEPFNPASPYIFSKEMDP